MNFVKERDDVKSYFEKDIQWTLFTKPQDFKHPG